MIKILKSVGQFVGTIILLLVIIFLACWLDEIIKE